MSNIAFQKVKISLKFLHLSKEKRKNNGVRIKFASPSNSMSHIILEEF